MRRLLQQISDRLQAFIDQRDNLALVLCSPAADALPLLKILEGLEETSTSDLFWTFTENFTHAGAYASAVVTGFAAKHEVMRLAMAKEGMTPWPPIPLHVLADNAPPAQRLRALAAFSRELLPIPNGGNNVWSFYPLEIANHAAFATLMEEVLQHEFPFPWCHYLRFIMREDPANLRTAAGTRKFATHRVVPAGSECRIHQPKYGRGGRRRKPPTRGTARHSAHPGWQRFRVPALRRGVGKIRVAFAVPCADG